MAVSLWLREESRSTERRTPLVPQDARALVGRGATVTVEDAPNRVFPTDEYAAVGCSIAPAGSWVDAPADAVVLGLKELPDEPHELRHRHVFFGHAYKAQPGADTLLRRFADGGGTLLDLEYLADADGRRLAAFGYWAGYVGAALAVLHAAGVLGTPLTSGNRAALDAAVAAAPGSPRALVVGALGRCGRGATDALTRAGITPTAWDLAETRELDKRTLLDHDVLVNAVYTTGPVTPFLTRSDLADGAPRALRTIADVTCDAGSAYNVLPIYHEITSWEAPTVRVADDPPVDLIAIDNLPSLLPREASIGFSADLSPHLSDLDTPPWRGCLARFTEASEARGA